MPRPGRLVELYGLAFDSELELPGRPLWDGSPDVCVRLAPFAPVGSEPPPGEIVAERRIDGRPFYYVTCSDQGYVLRIPATCEFRISPGLDRLECRVASGDDAEKAAVLLVGMVPAVLLGLAGHCVLHGSAVRIDGKTVAVVGDSGRGKTTLAALLCAAGAELVTDDVLRLELSRTVECVAGPVELRLRQGASELVELFPTGTPVRTTSDGRTAITVEPAPRRSVLDAIVVPYLDRDAAEISSARCSRADAFFELASAPRIEGWRHPELLSRQFDQLAEVVEAVPALAVRCPWPVPLTTELAGRLAAAVGAAIPDGSPGSAE